MSARTVCFTSGAGMTTRIVVPGTPSGVAVLRGGGVAAAVERELMHIDLTSRQPTPLPYRFDLPDGHIFNDVTVDTQGRMLVGSIQRGGGQDGRGRLFRVDRDRTPQVILGGFHRVNGLALSPDGAWLYVSDSHPDVRRVWRIRYDAAGGGARPDTVFVDYVGVPGRPDGAAIDNEGYYWSAAQDAGCVHCFAPDGRLERSISLPTAGPTKPAFGGPGLGTMFVTTAGPRHGAADDGMAGALFAVAAPRPGVAVPLANLA